MSSKNIDHSEGSGSDSGSGSEFVVGIGPGAGGAGVLPGAATVAVGLLGLVVTAASLWLADRAETTVTEILAALATGAATLAVAAAVLTTVLVPASRRAARNTSIAGLLSVCGLILVSASGLVQAIGGPDLPHGPQVSAQVAGDRDAMTLTVQVSFPGLDTGELMDAHLIGTSEDATQWTLARSATPAGRGGVATAALAAALPQAAEVVLEIRTHDQQCRQSLPFNNVLAKVLAPTCTTF